MALAIVNRAAAQIEEGLDAIMPSAQERLSLIGGLGPLFEQRLSPPYQAKLQKPLHDALTGAVQLAVKNFAPARKEAVHG